MIIWVKQFQAKLNKKIIWYNTLNDLELIDICIKLCYFFYMVYIQTYNNIEYKDCNEILYEVVCCNLKLKDGLQWLRTGAFVDSVLNGDCFKQKSDRKELVEYSAMSLEFPTFVFNF